MDQVRSFTSVTTASEDKMVWNAGFLCVVVSKFLQRKLAFDPIVQLRNTHQDVDNGFCS